MAQAAGPAAPAGPTHLRGADPAQPLYPAAFPPVAPHAANLYADRHARVRPAGDGRPVPARAEAVRTRGMPPIEGPERQRFREQAQRDFADFAMIGDAEAELVDGILTLRIDLRPPEKADGGDARG